METQTYVMYATVSYVFNHVQTYIPLFFEHRRGYPDIDQALNDNEAMNYRPPTPIHLRFEHDAMVREMLCRLYKK